MGRSPPRPWHDCPPMKIYTRQGDDGSTGLFGGRRLGKATLRVEAYGTLDETSAVVGWARAAGLPDDVDRVLGDVQQACFRLGAWLASAPDADPGVRAIGTEDIRELEARIDGFEEELPALQNFLVPGGSEGAARLHVARTVARRGERVVVDLASVETVDKAWLAWLNRLSDLLFVLARVVNARAGVADVPWAPRARGGEPA